MVIESIPSDVQSRFVVVEDLSAKTIYLLSKCLGISPEIYEEHLLNCGPSYPDPKPVTWNTRHLKKDYVSLQWYRPVKGSAAQLLPLEDRAQLYSSSGLKWTTKEELQARPEDQHMMRALANIIHRKDLPANLQYHHTMRPLVNIIRHGCPREINKQGSNGWSERVTIWNRRLGHCNLGICLRCVKEVLVILRLD